MTDEAIASYILQKTRSSIYYEGEKRVAEISISGLEDFLNVDKVTLTK